MLNFLQGTFEIPKEPNDELELLMASIKKKRRRKPHQVINIHLHEGGSPKHSDSSPSSEGSPRPEKGYSGDKQKKPKALSLEQQTALRSQLDHLKESPIHQGICEQLNDTRRSRLFLKKADAFWSWSKDLSEEGRRLLFEAPGKHFFEQLPTIPAIDITALQTLYQALESDGYMARVDFDEHEGDPRKALIDYELQSQKNLQAYLRNLQGRFREKGVDIYHPPVIGTEPGTLSFELIMSLELVHPVRESIVDLLRDEYPEMQVIPWMLDAYIWNLDELWNRLNDESISPPMGHHMKLQRDAVLKCLKRRMHTDLQRLEDSFYTDQK